MFFCCCFNGLFHFHSPRTDIERVSVEGLSADTHTPPADAGNLFGAFPESIIFIITFLVL